MDAGVVAGTLRPAPTPRIANWLAAHFERAHRIPATEGKPPAVEYAGSAGVSVPATLPVTAAQGHLRRHRSSTMAPHRRRRASWHLTPRRS